MIDPIVYQFTKKMSELGFKDERKASELGFIGLKDDRI
jgi:hypothetical protein